MRRYKRALTDVVRHHYHVLDVFFVSPKTESQFLSTMPNNYSSDSLNAFPSFFRLFVLSSSVFVVGLCRCFFLNFIQAIAR